MSLDFTVMPGYEIGIQSGLDGDRVYLELKMSHQRGGLRIEHSADILSLDIGILVQSVYIVKRPLGLREFGVYRTFHSAVIPT